VAEELTKEVNVALEHQQADERERRVEAAMQELGFCGCAQPEQVFVLLLQVLEEMTVPHMERAKPDVQRWASQAFRPCCGTCRAPMMGPRPAVVHCEACGERWDGSEATQSEAFYRSTCVPNTSGRMLALYVLDKLEMTEHGGSVNGGWLTQKGLKFLMDYRRHAE
jgi:hypothetical protein